MSGFISGTSRRLTWQRFVVALLACAAVMVLVCVLAPMLGVAQTRDGRSLEFLGASVFDEGSEASTIFWRIRVPRVLAGMLVGGALAGAGCALQALLRNPLAEPFTLGISSGASLFAVIAIRFGLDRHLGTIGIGGAAMIGAFVTLLLILQLARVGRHLPPATLVLAGVTLSMFWSSASVLIQYTSDFTEVSRMLRWMMGGLDSMQMSNVGISAIPIAVGVIVLSAFGHSLNAMAAGPEVAASLGVSVGRTQAIVFTVASALVGIAIALAGPIGFIGLIVPHALRAVLGPDHRLLIPASVFGGAMLLVICDTIARTLAWPAQLPTGAVTAVMGGPFFIYILVSQKRRAALWGRP
ncbi:MAG: FecCD family ABC transporter permease [Kofleriaceae bacterium]